MQRKTMVSISCAAVLCAAGMAQAQTIWNLMETTGGAAVPGNATSITNHNSGPVTCDLKPDWAFNNGGGLWHEFILTEDGGQNGVRFYASVQYLIESSAGNSPGYLNASRTLDVRVETVVDGSPTGNVPDTTFLQNFLPTTPFSGSASAAFNFAAYKCCPCGIAIQCDDEGKIEIDTGNGFEILECGDVIYSPCIVQWLAGAASASVFFEWDPQGNGGQGSLTVDNPIFLSDSATITPAPSSALLAVLGFGIAARRRR